MPGTKTPKRFAVIRLSSFGDIVLTEPITSCLKKTDEAEVVFITNSEYCDLVSLFPNVDRIYPYHKDNPSVVVKQLAREDRFEAVLDLQGNIRSFLLAHRLKTRKVVRYRREVLRRFLLVKAPWIWRGSLTPTVDLYRRTLHALGIHACSALPQIRVNQASEPAIMSRLRRESLISLCPGGSSPVKRWGMEKFADLARLLLHEGYEVVCVGSTADAEIVQAVGGNANIPVFVGKSVAPIAHLLGASRAVVTNDSGLMHLAEAAGSPVVALFGPTSPSLGFSPLRKESKVVTLNLDCSPCSYHGNRPCKLHTRRCMEEIQPWTVLSAVESIVKGEQ